MNTKCWTVGFTGKAAKQAGRLPQDIRNNLLALVTDLELHGPAQLEWRNYSKPRNKRGDSITTAT